jgi:hypothetical protein
LKLRAIRASSSLPTTSIRCESTRHPGTKRGAGADTREPDHDQSRKDALQLRVDLIQRPCDLHRATSVKRPGVHTQVGPVDLHVGQRAAVATACDRTRVRGDGQRSVARRTDDRPVCGQQLGITTSAAERLRRPQTLEAAETLSRTRRWRDEPTSLLCPRDRKARHLPRPVLQRIIDLAAQLRAHREIDERRHDDHHQGHGHTGGGGDSRPQAHGSCNE